MVVCVCASNVAVIEVCDGFEREKCVVRQSSYGRVVRRPCLK